MAGTEETTAALAAITQRDPGFDVQAFLSNAVAAYLLVDQAKREGRPDLVTDQVSPQARGALGIDNPQSHRRHASVPELGEPEIEAASTGAVDSITVRFSARREQERTVEDWTFQRPSTAVTAAGGPVCPQCGARDSRLPDGRCRFCNASIASTGWAVARTSSLDPMTSVQSLDRTGAELARTLAQIMAQGGVTVSSRPRRSATGCGCGLLFWLIVLAVVGGIGASITAYFVPGNPVHDPVAKIIPGVRRAHIDGKLTVTSGVPGEASVSFFHTRVGKCADLAAKTTVFEVDTPYQKGDMKLRVVAKGLSFGTAPRDAKNTTVTVSFDQVTPTAVHQTWQVTLSSVRFLITGDGSGESSFTTLTPTLTAPGSPQDPFTGTFNWTCKDK